ncbi:MAG: DUF86 domain-containing protein [Verrucomicrobia bacterium]|nr:DUF86 domain-containing protein [Verrucomicrobiota bacterium]
MSGKDDRLYVVHIDECLGWIAQFARDGKDVFLHDRKTQDAILRNLHVLAESTQRLSDSIKARHPEIPWDEIAGFRNVVVHDYLGIDLERTWLILEKDLPPLRKAIQEMKQSMDIS